jgi:selenium-binding protein 1
VEGVSSFNIGMIDMRRRSFLASLSATALPLALGGPARSAPDPADDTRTFATPEAARNSPRETLAYVAALYVGTGVDAPDYLATVDLDPRSSTYSRVIHRLPKPNVGDELHHFGWNACASCHGQRARRFLVVPGLASGRIHVIDTADPKRPAMHKVIEPEEVIAKAKLTGPHTVHCLADGTIMISMLGDENRDAPGGFLLLDDEFRVVGRWEASREGMRFNYDFWFQPRHGVMVSSEWAAFKTVRDGFKLDDVKAGRYGRRLQFWDWDARRIVQSIDLGEDGHIPLEVRFHHDPDSAHGFVGAALSSAIWHWFKDRDGGGWKAEKVVQVEPREVKGWDFPVPGLITDVVLSLDDRWLYFSDWLHGDVRQYDVSDPSRPRLAGRLWLGGVLGNSPRVGGSELAGGPQMLQLSLDGKRLYVTNSLFSGWDNQFHPRIAQSGSYLLQVDCDTDRGGLSRNERFHVDFGKEPRGPARAHEVRFPGGDSTSDIWL